MVETGVVVKSGDFNGSQLWIWYYMFRLSVALLKSSGICQLKGIV